MLERTNLTQTDETKAALDRSMLVAAYRYQIRTLRDRLAAMSGSDQEPLSIALNSLDDVEDALTLYVDLHSGDIAA